MPARPRKRTSHIAAAAENPYPVPKKLERKLKEVLAHWNSLKRGNADIPFADDVKLGAIPEFADDVLLVTVFAKPLRFRLESAGRRVARAYAGELAGRFADEISSRPPLDYFLSQCSATLDARAPTSYRSAPAKSGRRGYRRLLLPLWADGHIGALLGVIGAG